MCGLIAGVDGESESVERVAMQLCEFLFALRQRVRPGPVTAVERKEQRKRNDGRVVTGAQSLRTAPDT